MNEDENGSALDDIAQDEAAKVRILRIKERQARLKTTPGETAMKKRRGRPPKVHSEIPTEQPKKRGRKPKNAAVPSWSINDTVTLESVEHALDNAQELLKLYKFQREEKLKALVAGL